MKKIFFASLLLAAKLIADNQTPDVSPILVNKSLPFTIGLKLVDFTVPGGIQSAAFGRCGNKFLVITGRTNGLHGFDIGNDNFPPSQQNTNVFVININKKTVKFRSLLDPSSGLTQQQIDTLSVTSPQYYQCGNTLYITGGYGVDTSTGNFSTKDTLTAINVSGLMHWVTHPQCKTIASKYIRQISDPVFQVTGGYMDQIGKKPTLLMLGQNFSGFYSDSSNGDYTQQVRRFNIIDNGKFLGVLVRKATQPDPNYRRRDLNIVPIIKKINNKTCAAFTALSGVFTLSSGVWTVPVEITANGQTSMADPNLATTFKQGMNNYACAHLELLSKKRKYVFSFVWRTYL